MSIHEELKNNANWQSLLYNRYHQKVFGICLYFLKDREEAKDAAHDVFIKAFRAWGDFEWKCDPLTWIGAIAKHDCFSRMQRNRKQFHRRAQLALEEETMISPEPEEEMLHHRMRLEKVMPVVQGKLKEILRLSLEQGLNHREISIRLGVSRVAITRRLTRFKRDLQALVPGQKIAFPTSPIAHMELAGKPLQRVGNQVIPGRPKVRANPKNPLLAKMTPQMGISIRVRSNTMLSETEACLRVA